MTPLGKEIFFLIYLCFFRDNRVVGAASLMYDPVVSRFAELIAKGAVITKDIIL